jgi:hypothetical protein
MRRVSVRDGDDFNTVKTQPLLLVQPSISIFISFWILTLLIIKHLILSGLPVNYGTVNEDKFYFEIGRQKRKEHNANNELIPTMLYNTNNVKTNIVGKYHTTWSYFMLCLT